MDPEVQAKVCVAAVNGPRTCVLSGDDAAVDAVTSVLGGTTRKLNVSHAFHSSLMSPILDDFRAVLESVPMFPPSLSVISTMTGVVEDASIATAEYWLQHAIKPVMFMTAVRTLEQHGNKPLAVILLRRAIYALARRRRGSSPHSRTQPVTARFHAPPRWACRWVDILNSLPLIHISILYSFFLTSPVPPGVACAVEVGPEAVLSRAGKQCMLDRNSFPWIPTSTKRGGQSGKEEFEYAIAVRRSSGGSLLICHLGCPKSMESPYNLVR